MYEKEMAAKGIWPDASLSASLLKAACQQGRTALAKRLADHVGTMRSGGNSDLQRAASLIKAHARERDLDAAKAVFDRLCTSGATLSPLIFNALLDALVHCGDLDGALKHFEEMKRLKFADVVGYNTLLKGYLGSGRPDDARALVQEMADSGLEANKVTYNELLHSKVMNRDREGIWAVIEQMHMAGVRVNSVTCSILLKSLTVQSEFEDVKRVTDLIDEVEEAIDEVLFASVIEACIRIGHLDLLSDLMRRYKQKGGLFNLAAPTYGSMIKAYGAAGNVPRVRELWSEMNEHGVKPTAITVGCMTEALVINGQAEEAWNLVHKELESEERQASINTVIYSTVLKGFAVTKNISKVFTVYEEMKSKGISCNTITYNTMLDACAKCCAMSKASTLLEDMKEVSVEPDIITYSTIIKGYCLEGDVDRAFHVLEEMKRDDKFTPDEIMYNSILDGCAKEHRVDDALKILEEMNAAGVGPSNYTLSILVKLLGHARRLGQAFRLVEDLSKKNGFRPNVQVYTCMAQACVLNRRLDKALQLHDTMVADSGCRVDEKFYAVLAKGCLQMHQPLKAVEVIRAAYKLSGHSLAESTRRGPPIGVDARSLDEIASKIVQGGGQEERCALDALSADLLEQRKIRIGDGKVRDFGVSGGARQRRGGKGGGKGGGANNGGSN
jgi:pentatricopeptide repeat protein